MRYVCVFEGGGAKGIAHIGVLKAVRDLGCDMQGFAGTSAGAMIAALAAVGYSDDELVHLEHEPSACRSIVEDLWPHLDRQIVRRPPKSPLDLLGEEGRQLMWLTKRLSSHGRGVGRLKFTVALAVLGLSYGKVAKGLVPLVQVRDLVRAAMVRKFEEKGIYSIHDPTFADLREHGFAELRIIAANITLRRLEVFSCDTRPDVAIADAVAASIAIPGVFQPWTIPECGRRQACSYSDGGLVSNLPAWVFDDLRQIDRELITITSAIRTDAHDYHVMSEPLEWLVPTALTAIFGAGDLGLRGVGRRIAVTLDSELSLLDFAPSWAAIKRDVQNASMRARLAVEGEWRLHEWTAIIRSEVEAALRANGIDFGRIRVALASSASSGDGQREYWDDLMQYRYCQGFEDDPDYRITFSYKHSLIGETIRNGHTKLYEDVLAKEGRGTQFLFRKQDSKARGSRPPGLLWRLVCPLQSYESDKEWFPYESYAVVIDCISDKGLGTDANERRSRDVGNALQSVIVSPPFRQGGDHGYRDSSR